MAAPASYRKLSDLPETIPVFPLDGALLLPGAMLPLRIFEPRYLNMIDDVMSGESIIGMVQTEADGDRRRPRLARVGCAGRITSYSETDDGNYLIALTGVIRFGIGEELDRPTPYRQVRPDYAPFAGDLAPEADIEPFDRERFTAILRGYLERKGMGVEWDAVAASPPRALIASLSMALPFEPGDKQALLEAETPGARRAVLEALLQFETALGESDGDAPPSIQ